MFLFRQMILTGCVAFARHVGPTRVEAELLPQCWEQVSSRTRIHTHHIKTCHLLKGSWHFFFFFLYVPYNVNKTNIYVEKKISTLILTLCLK